jgi:hypothetical protein
VIGFVGLLDGPAGPLAEIPSGFGRYQTPRRTYQQAYPEPRFQLRDGFGDRGLADVQMLRRRGERPGLHDTNEGLHDGQSIHDEISAVSGLAIALGAQGFGLTML